MPTIHLYRRPGETRNWYALVYVHGKRHRFSCKTDNKRSARRFAQERAQRLALAPVWGQPTPTLRWSEVIARYDSEFAPRLRPRARTRMSDVIRFANSHFSNDPFVHTITSCAAR